VAKRKSGEESFADAQTAEQLAVALQRRLASGDLTTGETRAVELIAQLRGWAASKTSKSSATEPPAPVNPLLVEEPKW
jgi:hypothetical protein